MTRLTIDLSGEEKQRIKALAALHGQTLKDYVLERVLPGEETAEIGAILLRSLQENNYSKWSAQDTQFLRQKFKEK